MKPRQTSKRSLHECVMEASCSKPCPIKRLTILWNPQGTFCSYPSSPTHKTFFSSFYTAIYLIHAPQAAFKFVCFKVTKPKGLKTCSANDCKCRVSHILAHVPLAQTAWSNLAQNRLCSCSKPTKLGALLFLLRVPLRKQDPAGKRIGSLSARDFKTENSNKLGLWFSTV